MADILVVRTKVFIKKKKMDELTNFIRESMKTGLVVLPAYCETVVVPDGIEVRVENAYEATDH